MPVFLYWQNTADGSSDRFTVSLFSYLSPRWYPINIIGYPVYNIFEMYGSALSEAQAELDQTHNDLSIDTVRIETTGNQTTSKIFDNFGSQFGVGKQFVQDYDSFSTASVLSSYRQELRLLAQAFLNGGSVLGLNEVGYAFTGVAPLITQPLKSDSRWRLTNKTGSVVQATDAFIVPTESIYPFGSYIPAQDNNFVSGEEFIVSYSKLGTNTKLRSKKSAYSRLDLTFFTGAASTGSIGFLNTLIGAINHIIKADQFVHINVSDNLIYFRPQTGTGSVPINNVLTLSPTGYLYNSAPIFGTGSVYCCPIMQMPANYQNYDWFADWMIVQANDAHTTLELRSYGSSSIPSTVYYKEYNTDPVPLLGTPALNTQGVQWLFNTTGSIIYDISGNGFNLTIVPGSSYPTYSLSRNEQRLSLISQAGSLEYVTSNTLLLQFSSGFYSEAWISGIDNSALGNAHLLSFTNKGNATPYYIDFGLSITNQMMYLEINNTGGTSLATASIAQLFIENPCRPHLFGFTFYNEQAYFYLDGCCIGTGSVPLPIPVFPGDSVITVYVSGKGIGLDEVVWNEGFLTSMQAMNDFLTTKPRLSRLGISSGSVDPYYQSRVTLFAAGSHEIEFHQFSMRGIKRQNFIGKGLLDIDPYVVPLFKLNQV